MKDPQHSWFFPNQSIRTHFHPSPSYLHSHGLILDVQGGQRPGPHPGPVLSQQLTGARHHLIFILSKFTIIRGSSSLWTGKLQSTLPLTSSPPTLSAPFLTELLVSYLFVDTPAVVRCTGKGTGCLYFHARFVRTLELKNNMFNHSQWTEITANMVRAAPHSNKSSELRETQVLSIPSPHSPEIVLGV